MSALLVKELRQKTGAGILDCKKALDATNGDINMAIEWLKEKGIANAAKKANRIAADGLVYSSSKGNNAIIVEINSQTDFVAMNDNFKSLVKDIANTLIDSDFNNETVKNVLVNGETIEQLCINATAKIGEKISFRRAHKMIRNSDESFGVYTHSNGKIASIVKISSPNKEEQAKNVAMHVVAMNPEFLNKTEISPEIISKHEAEIAKNIDLKKPEPIRKKIAEGQLNKILSEITLINQPFVMETKQTVEQYLKSVNSEALEMIRFEVGEGIETIEENFAEEVAKQIKK